MGWKAKEKLAYHIEHTPNSTSAVLNILAGKYKMLLFSKFFVQWLCRSTQEACAERFRLRECVATAVLHRSTQSMPVLVTNNDDGTIFAGPQRKTDGDRYRLYSEIVV